MFPTILFVAALCSAQPTTKDIDVTSLNEHVKKMDALLQEVQSHSQAQEQKYSAVLSSVLSQLTQTTEELSKSKNITEELQLEVQEMKEINNNTLQDYRAASADLAELKLSHNKTLMDMAEMNQSHNKTLMELKSEVDSLQMLLHKDVGFEAFLGKTENVSEGRIVFDKVSRNEEKGYNNTTGIFTAPVSGTYLFWTSIVYKSNKHPITFRILNSRDIFGYAYGMANETNGRASGTTTFNLKQGEEAWVISRNDLELLAYYSSAGAVLIRQY